MPSWTLRRHCAGRGTDMAMIPITQHADMHGKTAVTARQMASRSGLRTAHKLGRNWMTGSQEPYPDHRRRMSEAPHQGRDGQHGQPGRTAAPKRDQDGTGQAVQQSRRIRREFRRQLGSDLRGAGRPAHPSNSCGG